MAGLGSGERSTRTARVLMPSPSHPIRAPLPTPECQCCAPLAPMLHPCCPREFALRVANPTRVTRPNGRQREILPGGVGVARVGGKRPSSRSPLHRFPGISGGWGRVGGGGGG